MVDKKENLKKFQVGMDRNIIVQLTEIRKSGERITLEEDSIVKL